LSRVGQAFLWSSCLAVVTGEQAAPRRRGSTLDQASCALDPLPPDVQVFTLAILHDSGAVTWPVERLEDSLIKWEADGRRVL